MRKEREDSPLAHAAHFISSFAGKIIIGALLVLLLLEGVRTSFAFGRAIFYQKPAEVAPGTDREIVLEQGENLEDLAKTLAGEGLIRSELPFVIQGKLYETELYPGSYTLNTSMTTKEILEKIGADGERYAEGGQGESAASEDGSGTVIGGGDDAVDEAQKAAAAKSGAEVETDAAPAETGGTEQKVQSAKEQDKDDAPEQAEEFGSGDEGV